MLIAKRYQSSDVVVPPSVSCFVAFLKPVSAADWFFAISLVLVRNEIVEGQELIALNA